MVSGAWTPAQAAAAGTPLVEPRKLHGLGKSASPRACPWRVPNAAMSLTPRRRGLSLVAQRGRRAGPVRAGKGFQDQDPNDSGMEVLLPPAANSPSPPFPGSMPGAGAGMGLGAGFSGGGSGAPGSGRGMMGMDVPEAPAEVQLVACLQSQFCPITVLQFPNNPEAFGLGLAGCRIMKLDSTNNIHSMYHPDNIWTDSYWDDLASVAALAPKGGTVGILGLGAGTVARIVRSIRPDLLQEGWELDKMVVELGRDFFGLAEVEAPSAEGGKLVVHLEDAFSAVSSAPEGFSCLMVDLFADGKLLSQLGDSGVWTQLKQKLAPSGYVVVNCGGPSLEPSLANVDDAWQATVSAMRAVLEVFPGQTYYKSSDELSPDSNYLVLAGPPFDADAWASKLDPEAAEGPHSWHPLTLDSPCLTR